MNAARPLPGDAVESTPLSDAAYAALFFASHANVLLIDPATGAIVDANPGACDFYGYARATLASMTMNDVNVRPHDHVGPEIAAGLAGGQNVFEFEHRLRSGELRNVEVTTGLVAVEDRELLFSIVNDTTARVRAERRAASLQRLYEAIVEIGRALGRFEEPEALYGEACRLAVEVAGFRSAFVALREDRSTTDLRIVAAAGGIANVVSGVRMSVGRELHPAGAVARALCEERTFAIDDVVGDPVADGFGQIAESLGFRSAVAVPLIIAGGCRGIVVVFAARPGQFEAREIGLLERTVGDVGTRVESIEREKAREAADARFRILFEQSRVPIALNRGATNLHMNAACLELFGLSADEADGRPILEIVGGDARESVQRRLHLRAAGIEPMVPYEVVTTRRDGIRVPIRVDPTPVDLPDGPATVTFITDLTASRKAEEKLRLSEARYRMLLEHASDPILICDENDVYIDVNDAACQLLGYARDELVGLTPGDLVEPEILPDQSRGLADLHAGRSILRERRLVRKDGTHVDAEISARRLPDGRILAIFRDITARKAAEAERDRLVAAVEQATDSVVMTAADGRIVYVNPAFTAITGFAPAEVLGRPPRDVMRYAGQPPELYEAMDRASDGGDAFSGRVINSRRDGSPVTVDLVISPLRDATGAVVGTIEVGRDVSHEQALEAQLRQAQKMEAVGRLAGGVAHDFNNLMTAISGYAELLQGSTGPDSPMTADIAEIRRAADRAASLTRQLLAFARKTVLQPRVLDLGEIVSAMAPMLRRLIGEDVALVVRNEGGLGRTLADPGQVEQLIMNLAVNARDAMPTGGTFTIETSNAEVDDSATETGVTAEPGSYVVLAVSDTGVGMTREVLDHIFEPFFTTKEQGKGTGLGLSTVFGVVKQSNGHITAYSEPGLGSTFRIYLPRVDAPRADSSIERPPRPAGGTETVLLVEDEDAVRRFAARVLERHGYRILRAPSAEAALALLDRDPTPIDLLFTDVVMPGMSGPKLGGLVRARRPGTRVLYTSGYSEEATTRFGFGDAGRAYLGKPYGADALLAAVRDVLDRPGEERSDDARVEC